LSQRNVHFPQIAIPRLSGNDAAGGKIQETSRSFVMVSVNRAPRPITVTSIN
jgi:hypothetical protein